MKEVTLAQVIESLKTVGVCPGEGVLVHSAIQYLGRPAGGVEMYKNAFDAVLGPEGTLAVPAFNFGFARGEPFDPSQTPSEKMGAFAEFVRRLPEAKRSPHPMQSVAVVGRWAADIAARETPSAFDPGSAFDRMLELDFRMVLLGATIQFASIVHYSEQKARVPYRYWKTFRGTIVRNGVGVAAECRMFARDLELDPENDFTPVQRWLEGQGLWRQVRLNYGYVAACKLRDVVAAADDLLSRDAWALVRGGERLKKRFETGNDGKG